LFGEGQRISGGMKTRVTWPLAVCAIYVVVIGTAIPVVLTFFPGSPVAALFDNEWRVFLWWGAILLPPCIVGTVVSRIQAKRRKPAVIP